MRFVAIRFLVLTHHFRILGSALQASSHSAESSTQDVYRSGQPSSEPSLQHPTVVPAIETCQSPGPSSLCRAHQGDGRYRSTHKSSTAHRTARHLWALSVRMVASTSAVVDNSPGFPPMNPHQLRGNCCSCRRRRP